MYDHYVDKYNNLYIFPFTVTKDKGYELSLHNILNVLYN
jgi:hypothetical protein